MRLLLDTCMSPRWRTALEERGYEAVHWTTIGDPAADDTEIMDYARREGLVVVTTDLDFGDILAASGARAPSVVVVRRVDAMPDAIGSRLAADLREHEPALATGAVLVVGSAHTRLRRLPIRHRPT